MVASPILITGGKVKFENILDKIEAIKGGEIMREANYSIETQKSPGNNLLKSKGWEELSAKYLNEEKALQTLNDLADKKNSDKDNRLKASQEILKLRNRYPKEKIDIDLRESIQNKITTKRVEIEKQEVGEGIV